MIFSPRSVKTHRDIDCSSSSPHGERASGPSSLGIVVGEMSRFRNRQPVLGWTSALHCGVGTVQILLVGFVETVLGEAVAQSISSAYTVSRSKTVLRSNTDVPDAVLVVWPSPCREGLESLLRGVRKEISGAPILVATESDSAGDVIELLGYGADDFVTSPIRESDLLPRLWHLLAPRQKRADLTRRLKAKLGLRQLVGRSPAFLEAVERIPIMAECDATVLVGGETGTGKELCARALHYLSPRSDRPFVAVNCGAIPVELVENELFGHQRDAYTGASSNAEGLIDEAEGGTLFLDEVNSLPLAAQVKLLRFLQEKEYRPLGSTHIRQADVRLVAASNGDMEEAVERGEFRRDLYYRLSVLPLALPPLRERREDIPLLAEHFLDKYAAEYGKPVPGLTAEALQALLVYEWPGNVRELEHVMERAVVFAAGHKLIRGADLALSGADDDGLEPFKRAKAQAVATFERSYLESLLLAHRGNISCAARAAQKNRRAFWELLRKHQIDAERFRARAAVG